jgi:transcriptional regulator with XRE-family HTH domain
VTEENGSPQDQGQPPEQVLTVNQVVAWNLAWFRRAAGLSQTQLGDMVGWKKSAVSDAERSVSGKWTREFDAQALAAFAAALKVPVGAFFLPPADDGTERTYYAEIPGEGDCPGLTDMAGLMALMLPDNDSDSPAVNAYRDRLRWQAGRYLNPYWHGQVIRWLDEAGAIPELRTDYAATLRHHRDQSLAQAAEWDRMADAVEKGGGQ